MILNIPDITIKTPSSTTATPDYPISGVGSISGCEDIVNITNSTYIRVNSFSICPLPNNTAIIAVESQQSDVVNLKPIDNELENSRRSSSRIYITSCFLDSSSKTPSPLRDAIVYGFDSKNKYITVSVDSDIFNSNACETIWVLDGKFSGKQFSVEVKESPNKLILYPYNSQYIEPSIGDVFHFVAMSDKTVTKPSISSIQSLPYIEVNGISVSSSNPQVAAKFIQESSECYIYVVAEAPVNGVTQLFFFSFKAGNDLQLYLWEQLTFNGENKNAKIKLDSHGNLHVTWESSRCQPGQIYYGIIGPGSRNIINQVFISSIDKQWNLFKKIGVSSVNENEDKSNINKYLNQSIVRILQPVSIDLREILDEYGSRGNTWETYTSNNGNVSITDDFNISLSGNPSVDSYIAKCTLNHDENDVSFDGFFSQLSYQVSFDLNLSSIDITSLTDDDVNLLYYTFIQGYEKYPLGNGSNYNFYTKNGNIYSISGINKIFEESIPVLQTMDMNAAPSQDDNLYHFMILATPEKVRFYAQNSETITQYMNRLNLTEEEALLTYNLIDEEIHYTGKYKLTMLISTSANLTGTLQEQKFHTIKEFGSLLDFNTIQNINIAIHYSKLRSEEVEYLQKKSVNIDNYNNIDNKNIRFIGNVIVATNGIIELSENFIPEFSNTNKFDIMFGSLPGKQYPNVSTLNKVSVYDNLNVTLDITNIAVGPHSIVADPYQTHLSINDRNVSRMVIKSVLNTDNTMSIIDETWNTEDNYNLTLGLNRTKVTLNSIPITFEGRCLSPSLSLDICDRPHIAYQSNRDGNWQIYYTGVYNPLEQFKFDTRITKTDKTSINPSISVNKDGKRIIVWQDNRNGKFQIYASKSIDVLPCNNLSLVYAVQDYLDYRNIQDEYDVYDVYSEYVNGYNICDVMFNYTNNNGSDYYNFKFDFYRDKYLQDHVKTISSVDDKYGWTANGVQIQHNGHYISDGETVSIQYKPSLNDNLYNEVFYVKKTVIKNNEYQDEYLIEEIDIYYCPEKQSPSGVIPCTYKNQTNQPISSVHFKLSLYSDSNMTNLISVSSTESNSTRWVSNYTEFPNNGIDIDPFESISVYYNPIILSPSIFNTKYKNCILCGNSYFVKVEAKINGVFTIIDTFSYLVSCQDVKSYTYKQDSILPKWQCSAQNSNDIRITNSKGNTLFPKIDTSHDGVFYITWEDYRFYSETETQKELSPDIYMSIYSEKDDIFYSSAQGYYDKRITIYSELNPIRYYKPIMVVGPFQNPSIFFCSRNDVFRKTCTLFSYNNDNEEMDEPLSNGVFNESTLNITQDDISKCIKFEVFKDDIISTYTNQVTGLPINVVDNPFIRFEIIGPTGTYSVRFKNENEEKWSDWISILPEIPNYPDVNRYNIRGDGSFRNYFEAYFIGDNKFIAKWGLSPGNGEKTIYCEILTKNGKTPILSISLITVYKEIKYKVDFYADSNLTIPLPKYNGYPVVSSKRIKINTDSSSSSSGSEINNEENIITENNVSSISKDVESISKIYVQVTFEDPELLQKMLNIQDIQKYNTLSAPGDIKTLSFNVLQQGLNALYGQPLTLISTGIYKGEFPIQKSDGIYNKDGLSVLIVNIPDAGSKIFTPDYVSDVISFYNVNKPLIGDFYGSYSIVPQETISDIKDRDNSYVLSKEITLDEFKLKYNFEDFCSCLSKDCENGIEPENDGYIHDNDEQSITQNILNIPEQPDYNL